MSTETKPSPILRLLWLLLLAGEVAATLWLACTRIYQVDEAQTVYFASIIAHGWKAVLWSSGQLHLFPLSLLVRPSWSSAQIFTACRIAFWALSWINVALTVVAAGIPLRSREALKAVVIAGSLATWWAYGLECRHDNILIFGVLLMWIVGRRIEARSRPAIFFGVGALALLLQACLFKAVATWAPLSLLLVLVEPGPLLRKGRLVAGWLLGAGTAFAFGYGVRAWAGLLGNVNEGPAVLGQAMALTRFSPVGALERLLEHAPLVAAAMAVLIVRAVQILRERGFRNAFEAEGAPEIGLFLVGLVAFLANPTPFPYNVAILSGLAMVAVLTLGARWLADGAVAAEPTAPYLITAALVLHVLPLARRYSELAAASNEKQEAIMTLAEALTGPNDPVFDDIGLVPTRRAPSYIWVINSTNVEVFAQTPMTSTWSSDVPAVVIPSYRFSFFQEEDRKFVQSQYVPLRRDVYVLGASLTEPASKRAWTCQRSGRYAVVPVTDTFQGLRVDGVILAPGFHDFEAGGHELEALPDSRCVLVWAGPNLRTIPDWRPNVGLASACPVPTQL